jgi:hypothetical protein
VYRGADRPGQPGEAIRLVGRLAYSGFASTMADRVVLFALGEAIDDVISAVPKAYSVTIPDAVVKVTRLEPRRLVFERRNVYCFVDTYHRGVIEGALIAFGSSPSSAPCDTFLRVKALTSQLRDLVSRRALRGPRCTTRCTLPVLVP